MHKLLIPLLVMSISSCSEIRPHMIKSSKYHIGKIIPGANHRTQLSLDMIEQQLGKKGEPIFENTYSWFITEQRIDAPQPVRSTDSKKGRFKSKSNHPVLTSKINHSHNKLPTQAVNYMDSDTYTDMGAEYLCYEFIIQLDEHMQVKKWRVLCHR